MNKYTLLVTVLLLYGCAPAPVISAAPSEPSWHWEKAGATQEEFNIDAGNCKAQAFSNNPDSWLNIAMIMQGCMQGKGWKQAPNFK